MIEFILPLPPSENELYRNVPGRGRAATRELREWKAKIALWILQHQNEVRQARAWIREQKQPLVIDIQASFVIHRPRLWCKKGNPKRLDASNRIKALHDAVAEILGVDDKHVWGGTFQKVECERLEDQCSLVKIELSDPTEFRPRLFQVTEH